MSSQQQVSISFSSAQRDTAKWPDPSCYEVRLPMPVPRVRQVVLGAVELPLNNDTVQDEAGGSLPVDEGCELTADDSPSCCDPAAEPESCTNVLHLCEEGGRQAVLAIPRS